MRSWPSPPVYSKAGGTEQPRWRASSNESFLPPSAAVLAAVDRAARQCQQYPTLQGDPLIAALASSLAVDPAQPVAGAGSLAVLQQLLAAFTGPATEVVFAWRSYEAYPILVRTALSAELALRGLDVPHSGANFLWLPVGSGSGSLEAACLAEGVSVRCFAGEGVRVTVGSREAEAAVLRGVDAWLAAGQGR